jgi:hypothetical protein
MVKPIARCILAFYSIYGIQETDPSIISYGLYHYYSSRSFRLAAKILGSILEGTMLSYGSGFRNILIVLIDSISDRGLVKEIYLLMKRC